MKLLEKLTYEKLKDKSREALELDLQEELKYVEDRELMKILIDLRSKKIAAQRAEIQHKMQADVDKCLADIKIIKAEDKSEKEKQIAFDRVMGFLKKEDFIISLSLLRETYYLLEYVVSKKL